ncbi:hypothetical protein Y1Q_0016584 [Alligator mississippiensis]|uniref:Uncharacterized protein n=1 Tax=Alligator mississippiensis TaxID=8496 RepID=A0A151MJP3_ALLMI|nr:hypothetical protein Y1Q_0016584 [Alligator mississippiensis]
MNSSLVAFYIHLAAGSNRKSELFPGCQRQTRELEGKKIGVYQLRIARSIQCHATSTSSQATSKCLVGHGMEIFDLIKIYCQSSPAFKEEKTAGQMIFCSAIWLPNCCLVSRHMKGTRKCQGLGLNSSYATESWHNGQMVSTFEALGGQAGTNNS